MLFSKRNVQANQHVNWDHFRLLVNKRSFLKVPLKTEEDIEAAVTFFNDTMQWAVWNATPENTATPKANNCSILITKLKKRRLQKLGLTAHPGEQTTTHRSNTGIEATFQQKNDCIQTFLQGLTHKEPEQETMPKRHMHSPST
jgi:hypothetical protein